MTINLICNKITSHGTKPKSDKCYNQSDIFHKLDIAEGIKFVQAYFSFALYVCQFDSNYYSQYLK